MESSESESTMSQNTSHRSSFELGRREAILQAASEHVRHYGYQKTTVADIAKAIQLSPAYLYHFFDSKQAIGEAVCTLMLEDLIKNLANLLAQIDSPGECIIIIISNIAVASTNMFLEDRKMHDLMALSFREKWASTEKYRSDLLKIVREVVIRGREIGEFERKTPLDETCEAIHYTMEPFYDPILVQQNPLELPEEAVAVAKLVRRSLTL
ncbi:TetR/AcrR family transcriptional regulator [Acidisarcina polymorpha]|uniref:TetR/AcrR family transcriptional regulator n=1 Tax=Acidisarcina polymorpha TaxID=2211140 RepID=UPI000DEF5B37|nr:TetR/AcrR family transcriptional regulator [Acidisarcina polymorpha]